MTTIRFWGVRGSIAASGAETVGVGGNTSCVEVRCGDELIILDAGTGLRALGASLLERGGPVRATMLVSHFHWDHIQGFPFFTPAYLPSTRLSIAGPGADPRAAFAAQMSPPHFPVGLDAMRAAMAFRGLAAGDAFDAGAVTVRAAAARHPGGCLAYRLEHEGRALCYATDTEHDGAGLDPSLLALARGADVLVYDAQYTPDEYRAGKVGWGHSTAEEGARLAAAAGASRLLLYHHDPSHDDGAIARIEAAARAIFPASDAAREGMEIRLSPRNNLRERLDAA